MNKFLIGLLALGSISAFADNGVSVEGRIFAGYSETGDPKIDQDVDVLFDGPAAELVYERLKKKLTPKKVQEFENLADYSLSSSQIECTQVIDTVDNKILDTQCRQRIDPDGSICKP